MVSLPTSAPSRRSQYFASGMYTFIAGFVEPGGPIIEETAVSEVKEKGRHCGSGYPLLWEPILAFSPLSRSRIQPATSIAGEISIGDSENEEAGWFTVGYLLPSQKDQHRTQINGLVR